MKNLYLTIFLTIFCFAAAAQPEFEWKLNSSAPHVTLTIPGKSGITVPGAFRIYNGKSKKFDRIAGSVKDGSITLAAKGYTVTLRPEIKGKILLFNGAITNKSGEELFLQPELVFLFPAAGGNCFFNGYETLPSDKLPIRREGLKGRPSQKLAGVTQVFPAAGVIGNDFTVFAGIVPHDLVSYHAAVLEKAGKNRLRFIFNQRHAVAPGRTVNFRMVAGLTATAYGREEAMIQRMFDSFPELFSPVVSWDNPYIWGTEQYLQSWNEVPDYELERRYHATLTWAFVPFKRAGDIYGEADLWDYKPYRPFKWWYNTRIAGKVFDYRNLSNETFHRQRREVFQKYAGDFGYSFYNSAAGVWCEDQLAVARYSDAIVDDTDKVQKYLSPWCTPWDQHVRVFSYRTSFGKKFREDMKKVYDELGMPGFAFDCAAPGACYRGPAAQDPDMPGRAWDEKGVFVDQTVAVIKMTDFVHEELPGAFVWLNGITGRGDTTMLEYGIFEDSFRSVMPVVRYNAGQIPMQTRGYGFNRFLFDYLPDWRNMTKKEFLSEVEKLSVHLIFNYFQYGLTGTYNTANGCSLEQYIMPELLKVRKLGWQAQAPVKVDTDRMFYSSRFGTKENSVLFMGNPYEESVVCQAEVGNKILGDADYLWVRMMRDKAETLNSVKKGKTGFKVDLASRIPILYESVCGMTSLPQEKITVNVSSQKDIDRIIYRLQFTGNPEFTTALLPRRIEEFKLNSVKVDGQNADPAKLVIGKNSQIVLEYVSEKFAFSRKDLYSFPFVKDGKKAVFEIRLPQDANENELRQATRLKGVFDFLVKHKVLDSADIAVVKGNGDMNKPGMVISVGRSAEKAGVSLLKDCWQITAPDAASADSLVREFSYILDQRFEYIFPFEPRAWDCLHPDMLKYFDLNQDRLPLVRCFESERSAK